MKRMSHGEMIGNRMIHDADEEIKLVQGGSGKVGVDGSSKAAPLSRVSSTIKFSGPRRVAMGCDDSQNSVEALHWATEELVHSEDTLILIYIIKAVEAKRDTHDRR